MKLTHEYLLRRLDYNQETGDLIWKERFPDEFPPGNISPEAHCKAWNTRYANKIAGSLIKATGYIEINIGRKHYLAHRLCYFYSHGYMPEGQIDHKDRIRHHNWIGNLREATQQCQSRNAGIGKNNTSGVVGVSLDKKSGQWDPNITINSKTIHLGKEKIFGEAVMKRWKAEVKYKFPNCCTSSSAYNYLKDNGLIK